MYKIALLLSVASLTDALMSGETVNIGEKVLVKIPWCNYFEMKGGTVTFEHENGQYIDVKLTNPTYHQGAWIEQWTASRKEVEKDETKVEETVEES